MLSSDEIKAREDHGKMILILANEYVRERGMELPEAITAAGADYRAMLRREGKEKIAAIKRWLKLPE